jgi:hypothetical protein
VSNAKIPARSGGQGKLRRGIVELRAGAVTRLCLSQRAPVRQSIRAVDQSASNSLAIKPDPSSYETTLPLSVAFGSLSRDADFEQSVNSWERL